MANTLRIKRRVSGSPGAPTTLANAELAFNEVDSSLYYGVGTGGAGGSATSVIPIGGAGAFVDKSSAQTVAGVKTFSSSPIVPTTSSADNSTNAASTAFVNGYVASQKGAASGLASLAADGTLTPTQIPAAIKGAMKYAGTWNASTNTPALSSGAGVQGAVYKVTVAGNTTLDGHATWYVGDTAVFNGATWDKWDGTDVEVLSVNGQTGAVTLNTDNISEGTNNQYMTASRTLAVPLTGLSTSTASPIVSTDTILGSAGKLQAQVNARLVTANNLSDLANAVTARTNLGLGTMAIQNANAVAITGGTVDGVSLDGGVF